MVVRCLGSGDAFGSNGKLNTCFYMQAGEKGLLLECGATSLVAMKKAGLSSTDIDIVIISHLHGDHFGGIPFLITERQVKGDPSQPLHLIGPPGLRESALRVLEIFFPGIAENLRFPLRFITFNTKEEYKNEGMMLTAFDAAHSPQTNPHSLRLQLGNHVIAYSGDTEWYDGLIQVSEESDLFICEGYAFNHPESNHMDIKKLLQKLPEITAKRILLTHLSEEAYAERRNFDIEVAEDGQEIMI